MIDSKEIVQELKARASSLNLPPGEGSKLAHHFAPSVRALIDEAVSEALHRERMLRIQGLTQSA